MKSARSARLALIEARHMAHRSSELIHATASACGVPRHTMAMIALARPRMCATTEPVEVLMNSSV